MTGECRNGFERIRPELTAELDNLSRDRLNVRSATGSLSSAPRLSAGTRACGRLLPGAEEIPDAPDGNRAVRGLEREFLFVCSSVLRRVRAHAIGLLDSLGIQPGSHVISGQTGCAGFGGEVGLRFEQCRDGRWMSLFNCPHQRGCSANAFLRVDIGAASHEQMDSLGIAASRRKHDHGFACRAALFGVGSRFDQAIDHCGIPVLRSKMQRRNALAIPGIDFRARLDQQIGGFDVVVVHGPVHRRRAVNLRRIDIGLLLNECAKCGAVAFHRGIGNIGAARRPSGEAHRAGKKHQRKTEETCASNHAGPYSFTRWLVLSPWLSCRMPYQSRMVSRRFPVVTVFLSK